MLTNFPEFIRRDSVLNLQYNHLVIICGLSRVKYSPTALVGKVQQSVVSVFTPSYKPADLRPIHILRVHESAIESQRHAAGGVA